MNTITVAFNDNPPAEVEKMEGVIMSVPWDALINTVAEFVKLRPGEVIDGFVVNDIDIKVKISRKRGRKTKAS